MLWVLRAEGDRAARPDHFIGMSCSEHANQDDAAKRRRLADALELGTKEHHVWTEDDIASVFRHQMDAPVAVDLSALDPAISARLALLANSKGLLLRSFRDLLQHPAPPVELLVLTKEFAKANRGHPESALPNEVATLLYFASIATALARCATRITRLTDAELAEGFDWALRQSWVDEPMRRLFNDARRLVSQTGAA
jgi:hypothetical protein